MCYLDELVPYGGEEHWKLKLSQFRFAHVPNSKQPGTTIDCVITYMYVEHRSKIRPGGTHQLNLNNKEVVQLAYPGDRCYVSLLKLYFSKLPAEAFEAEVFYTRLIAQTSLT